MRLGPEGGICTPFRTRPQPLDQLYIGEGLARSIRRSAYTKPVVIRSRRRRSAPSVWPARRLSDGLVGKLSGSEIAATHWRPPVASTQPAQVALPWPGPSLSRVSSALLAAEVDDYAPFTRWRRDISWRVCGRKITPPSAYERANIDPQRCRTRAIRRRQIAAQWLTPSEAPAQVSYSDQPPSLARLAGINTTIDRCLMAASSHDSCLARIYLTSPGKIRGQLAFDLRLVVFNALPVPAAIIVQMASLADINPAFITLCPLGWT